MEIHKVSPPTVTFIVINITFGVTSAINVAAMARKTRYNQLRHTYIHTHSRDTTDTHIPTTPLSDCLSPSSLVSLSLSLSHSHKHNRGYNDTTAVCGGTLLSFRY